MRKGFPIHSSRRISFIPPLSHLSALIPHFCSAGYMCATNLTPRDPDHAATMVRFALRAQEEAAKVLRPDLKDGSTLQLRIGAQARGCPQLSAKTHSYPDKQNEGLTSALQRSCNT